MQPRFGGEPGVALPAFWGRGKRANKVDSTRCLVCGAGILGGLLSVLIFTPEAMTSESGPDTLPLWNQILQYVTALSFVSVPLAIGFAVLRYRLYATDLLINRTLVYGSLGASSYCKGCS
jgi:hypothetical protein